MSRPIIRRAVALMTLLLLSAGCDSRQKGMGGQRPILVINDLEMSGEDLRKELALAARAPEQSGQSRPEEEPEWISRVIERELLVQEAQRLGLDRDPEFMGSIERLWKEALLKQLIRMKGQEISSHVQVYEPEIEQRYAELAQQDPSMKPLAEVRQEIQRMVRQEKEQREIDQWVAGLKARAKIQMDREAIAQLK